MFCALCFLPSEEGNILRAMTKAMGVVPPTNTASAKEVRDAICTSLLERTGARIVNTSKSESINEVLYEAGRDGLVAAVSLSLPGRVTSLEKMRLKNIIDEIRVEAPFSIIRRNGQLLSFEEYAQGIVLSASNFAPQVHEIVRPNPASIDYSDSANVLAALVSIAIMPFIIATYMSLLAEASELTFMVQMYMKVLHRNAVADMIANLWQSNTLFNLGVAADKATVTSLTNMFATVRDSSTHRLSSSDVTTQMGIVMNSSQNARAQYANLSASTAALQSKATRVQDYKYRERVEAEEVNEERRLFYAWAVACALFLVAGSILVLTNKNMYFFVLLAVALAVVGVYIAARKLRQIM